MVENAKTKKAIIWLEDHPDYFPELHEMINGLGFELIICKTLEEFKKATDKFKTKPNIVAGFIIDVALGGSNNDLSALGLSHIMTHQGGITGIQIVIHFLLGLHNENGSPFAYTPIAIVTVLESSDKIFESLVSTSPYTNHEQALSAMSRIKFIYKQDDGALNGGRSGTSGIKQWLSDLE